MDQLKIAALGLIDLTAVLAQTAAIPQIVKFSSAAENALDEVQETAFAIITSLLHSKLP